MAKSMTGFGRGEFQNNGMEFRVEIKTVNHRYIDVFIKVPRQISFLEDKIREVLTKSISRGKIDIFVNFDCFGENKKEVLFDEYLADAYIDAIRKMKEKYNLRDDVSISLISKFPDILKVEKVDENEEELWEVLKVALNDAISSLIRMREKEGIELKKSLLEKLVIIEEQLVFIKKRAPEVVKEYKIRLENRINELLEQKPIDEYRIATEVAVFADRCSIDEEIVRLSSHILQFRNTLDLVQPIGRKLDFIIQEMNREINTIGSKANDLKITRNVVEVKGEIEKIREQAQNIE